MKYLFCLLSFLLFATPAWADVSRDEAVAVAQKNSGGRVLAVEKTNVKDRPVWRIKVLTPQGEVKILLVDAANGHLF